MRAGFIAAALVAGAIAVPFNEKRGVVYHTEVAVVTNVAYVTVTEGAPAPAETVDAQKKQGHFGHRGHPHPKYEPKPLVAEQPEPKPEPTTEKAAPKPEPTQSGGLARSYKDKVLLHHNIHRQNHSTSDMPVPDVEWDQELADIAKEHSSTCNYGHRVDIGNRQYGQNIAAGTKPEEISKILTNAFYNDEFEYFANTTANTDDCWGSDWCECEEGSNFHKWGHLTQMVWADTTHVGCYTYDCTGSGIMATTMPGQDMSNVPSYFTVCNYASAGNVQGSYRQAGVPQGHPMVDWTYGIEMS